MTQPSPKTARAQVEEYLAIAYRSRGEIRVFALRIADAHDALATENAELKARVAELEKEVVSKEERFIACASHLEGPHHCQISEPGNYVFLLKIHPDGSHVSMFQKTNPAPMLDNEAIYPCQEWRDFRRDKKPWPQIPFKNYAEYRAALNPAKPTP